MDKKPKKIYIPLSITDTVSGYSFLFSNKKVAIMLVYWIFVTLGTVLLKGILMSPLTLFLYLVLAFIGFVYIVRFKVLEEKRLKKLYNDQLVLNPSKVQPFWKIIDISSNGLIRYDVNKAGMIIRIDKSTIVGREEGFKDFHYVARSNMLRYLFERNYNILYINTEHQHNLREKVAKLYSLANSESEIVRDIFSAELSFIVANSYLYGIQETEYYLVFTNNYNQIKDIERDCLTAISYIQHTAVCNVGILDREGVVNLFKHLNGINHMDVESLIVNEIQAPVKKKVSFRITKEYDSLGIEKAPIEIPGESFGLAGRKTVKDIELVAQENNSDDIFSLLNNINEEKKIIIKTMKFKNKESENDFADLE